jgi:hypothetical protein
VFFDGSEDVVRTVEDLGIIETEHRKAFASQEHVSMYVMPPPMVGPMGIAIDFDNDPCRQPSEIGYIGTDRGFAPKPGAKRAEIPEHIPHFRFGLCQLAAQALRSSSCFGSDIGVGH